MKKYTLAFCLAALTFFGLCGAADAKSWEIDYGKSFVGFTGAQGGTEFHGVFKSFKATVDFDPDHPEKGRIKATIDTGSATTSDDQRDGMLPQSDWFAAKQFPQADFVSTDIQRSGPDSFEVNGTLTIKGLTRRVKITFTLTPEGDHWVARGKTKLLRTDFHIGEGQWADESMVRIAVDVDFEIAAKTAA